MKQLYFTQATPLNQEDDGTIRLKGSRVTLDTLIAATKRGDTLEQIHEGFPSLSLEQICGAIAWYLNHQVEGDNYFNERAVEAQRMRQLLENRPGYAALRKSIHQRRRQ